MERELNRIAKEMNEGPASLYVLHGDDRASLQRALDLLQSTLAASDGAEWSAVKVDGKDSDGSDILNLASTPPFMGDRRVVIVRAAQELTNEKALLPFVHDPPDFATLILVYVQADKRGALFQAAKKQGRVFSFESPRSEQLPRRLRAIAEEVGLSLDDAALNVILERIGDDLLRAEQEMSKLAAYARGAASVSAEEAKAIVADGFPTLESFAVFNFVDAIAEGRSAKALSELDALLRAGQSPLSLLGMIARQFRLVLGARAFWGEAPETLSQALGLKSAFPSKKAFAQARSWSWEEAAEALRLVADCDERMKLGVEPRQALELLIVRLTRLVGAKKEPRSPAAPSSW